MRNNAALRAPPGFTAGLVRDVLDGADDAIATPDEDAIRSAVGQLAEAQPEKWAAVAEALTRAGADEPAPNSPY